MNAARSCGQPLVESKLPTEARVTVDRSTQCGVVTRRLARSDDPAADALVVALGVVVRERLVEQMPQVALTEDDEVIQALGLGGLHEPLCVRVAVRALRGNRHALHAARLQK